MPLIFIVHQGGQQNWLALANDALHHAHSGWHIERRQPVIRLGMYMATPVELAHVTAPHVVEESSEIADVLAHKGIAPEIIARIRHSPARFELYWDIPDDPDPLPETAELMLLAASTLVALTNGIAIDAPHLRLLDFDDPDFILA